MRKKVLSMAATLAAVLILFAGCLQNVQDNQQEAEARYEPIDYRQRLAELAELGGNFTEEFLDSISPGYENFYNW